MASETVASPACHDPGRVMFHDRVGRFFHDGSEITDFLPALECHACGKALDRGVVVNGRAVCAAQRSVSAKRAGVNGLPVGAEPSGQRPYAAFNAVRKAAFITPDETFVITAVKPTAPIPPDMTVRTEGTNQVYGEFYSRIYGSPVKVPALYIEFTQSGYFEFAVTESPDQLLRCGGPVVETIDGGRVREIVAAGRAVGRDGLRKFNQLRRRSVLGDFLTDAERARYVDLRDRIVSTGIDPASPPTPHETAYRIAGIILGSVS